MKRNKLSEVHQTQLEDMVKANDMKAVEIIAFFKTNYKVNIMASKISLMRKNLGIKSKGKPGRKPVEPAEAVEAVGDLEVMATEMVGIIKETRQATKDVFLGIRLELIKSRNEVFLMKRGIRGDE